MKRLLILNIFFLIATIPTFSQGKSEVKSIFARIRDSTSINSKKIAELKQGAYSDENGQLFRSKADSDFENKKNTFLKKI